MTYTETKKSYSIRTKNGEPIITFQDEYEALRYWRDIGLVNSVRSNKHRDVQS